MFKNYQDFMTVSEAAEMWGISASQLRKSIAKLHLFDEQIKKGLLIKEFGGWLISDEAMTQVFGCMPELED
jgi:hypothetical protein